MEDGSTAARVVEVAGTTKTNISLDALLALAPNRDNTCVINRHLVRFCDGDIPAAMMLSQLLYWTPKARIAGGWIAKSDAEFQEELCGITEYAVQQARKLLSAMGVVEYERRSFKRSVTSHYRVNADLLLTQWQAYVSDLYSGQAPSLPFREAPASQPAAAPKAAAKPSGFDLAGLEFPAHLTGEPFESAWADWVAHRREVKAKLTFTNAQGQLRTLFGPLTAEDAVYLIRLSIQNGWKGIFPEQLDRRPRAKDQQAPANGDGGLFGSIPAFSDQQVADLPTQAELDALHEDFVYLGDNALPADGGDAP